MRRTWTLAGIAVPAARGGSATAHHLRLPPPPWRPILHPSQLQRGLAFYGSGGRIERVAAKLLAGRPIKAFTTGGSVTNGGGASSDATAYPARFFKFLNATFPHSGHVLANKAIGGATSAILSLCAEALIPPDADIVVAEFTFDEAGDLPFATPQRRAFEQLLRRLARLPGRPAVLVLHHYAWWLCAGDGAGAGLYYGPAEQQLSTLAQYYDMPSPSVRTAVWPQMRAGVAPFKVSHVLKGGQVSPQGAQLPVATPGTEAQYFFYDKVHPSDVGHQVMAELLAGVVMQAVENVAASSAAVAAAAAAPSASPDDDEGSTAGSGASSGKSSSSSSSSSSSGGETPDKEAELPPQMIPGNADISTTLCAMQEELKELGREMDGFRWCPERPNGTTLIDQNWGYCGLSIGDTIVLELSTADTSEQAGKWATLYLGYLRSYEGMGLAKVACGGGCSCEETLVDAQWEQQASLTHMHDLKVTQSAKCRVRLTIVDRSSGGGTQGAGTGGNSTEGAGPSSGGGGNSMQQDAGPSTTGGSKFQLTSVMVAHLPVVLDNRIAGRASGMAENG